MRSAIRGRLRSGSRALALGVALLLGLAPACATSGRRPLISFDDAPRPKPRPKPAETAHPEAILMGPPARPLVAEPSAVATPTETREEIEALVARLGHGKHAERKPALERLVKLGPAAVRDLEAVRDEATFEADLMREALARIESASEPAAPGPDRPRLGPVASKKPVAAPWVDAKYRLALDRFLAGDALGALALVDAILLLEPNGVARPKVDRLRREIRDRMVAETVIATSVEPERRLLGVKDKLRAKVRLESRSRDDVVLRAGPGGTLGQVVLEYEELRADGTRGLRRSSRPVKVTSELRLTPGGKVELDVDLPDEHTEKPAGTVGRYRLGGALRPFTLLTGEEPLPYFLRIEPAEVLVLDAGDLALAEDGPRSFERCLEPARDGPAARLDEAARQLFVAAVAWACQDRDHAIAACVGALEKSGHGPEGPLARTLGAALARATGEPGSYTREEWLEWWRTGRGRPRAHTLAPEIPGEDDGPR